MNAAVDLSWIPLGAGGHVVAFNGRAYEAIAARVARRTRAPLFHAALEVCVDGAPTAIEMAPAWADRAADHGAVATGPVGLRWLGRSRWFRYEVRRWTGGVIPDIAYAVDGPVRLSDAGGLVPPRGGRAPGWAAGLAAR